MPFPFDPTVRSFSLTNAFGCALAAQLAYKGDDAVNAALKAEWGFDAATHYSSLSGSGIYDTHAFVATRRDLILVAFRGTDPQNIKNWLTDVDAVMVATPIGHVHFGVLGSF